jgi:hypothetical protein
VRTTSKQVTEAKIDRRENAVAFEHELTARNH